jgi:hypothetical protein
LISCECKTANQGAQGKQARKKASAIKKTVNQATGKESTMSTNFNLVNWGSATDSYFQSVRKNLFFNGTDFDLIIQEAVGIANANRRPDPSGNSVTDDEANDEHACLVDDSSDSD